MELEIFIVYEPVQRNFLFDIPLAKLVFIQVTIFCCMVFHLHMIGRLEPVSICLPVFLSILLILKQSVISIEMVLKVT
jgi:hypothetical protein